MRSNAAASRGSRSARARVLPPPWQGAGYSPPRQAKGLNLGLFFRLLHKTGWPVRHAATGPSGRRMEAGLSWVPGLSGEVWHSQGVCSLDKSAALLQS